MRKIVLPVAVTAICCFGISAAIGLASGAKVDSRMITVSLGDRFYLSDIGWFCDYSASKKEAALSCSPGASETKIGDPSVLLERSSVSLIGDSRPHIDTLNTPGCCLRGWTFPAQGPGTHPASHPSDVDLAPPKKSGFLGNSVSVPTLDLICRVLASDPDHHDPGPVFLCDRQSVTRGSTATIEVSRYHMRVADANAKVWAYSATRSP